MAPTRYSLHYEDYSEHLMSRFGKLLQMQSLVDMTLMCSSHTLRVHKAVLAASSAYFQEVLQNQTGEPLIILKMRFSVLKSLVEFMYCGKTQCLEENLDELVSAAQFLKIKGLSKVTKEGLGIANNNDLPVFTPPVVISRPPQSLIELNSQEVPEPKLPTPYPVAGSSQPMESIRSSKEMVVRIPFDIEKGGGGNYQDPPRPIKPRRGRPSARRSGWEGPGLGRAAERALLRREQDSRKAIHHLKHLQSRHMQEYMDQVTLTQAVNSICGPDSSSHNYTNIDNNYMYLEQPGSSGLAPPAPYAAEPPRAHEAPAYTAPTSASEPNGSIGTAMSQYVNALKNAGLPTDLPILFESGDGSYVNVNEQVLMDMVQSSEIQYEVIDQPNIIESVADPNGIKSIDDLSKSIERGEMLMDVKNYAPPSFEKNTSYRHEDAINSLDSILPDNLVSFGDQQNYVVLDSHLAGGGLDPNMAGGGLDPHLAGGALDAATDFSCIDENMQFFTKSMSDDVKKYYSSQTLEDARDLGLGHAGAALDASFTISLLDSKNSHMNTSNPQDLTRNDCYDFGLPLPQMKDFKEDALDCLIATPKRNDNDNKMLNTMDDDGADERAKIIKDLMNIEKTMNLNRNADEIHNSKEKVNAGNAIDYSMSLNEVTFEAECRKDLNKISEDLTSITSSGLQWNDIDLRKPESQNNDSIEINEETKTENENQNNLSESEAQTREYGGNTNACITESVDSNMDSTIDEDIPFAVGLQPLRPAAAGDIALKRSSPVELDLLDNMDAKCLRRKAKHKKL